MPFTKGHKVYGGQDTRFKKGHTLRVGMKHTEESKEANRIAHLGKGIGATNASWKGGITPLLNKIKRLSEYKDWVKKVFQRDNFTCRSCFKRGSQKITAHHLVSFSFIVQILKVKSVKEAREQFMLWNIRNGVTLCDDCHKKTPNYSWRATKKPRDRTLYKPIILGLLLLCFFLPQNSEAATFGYTSLGASSDLSIASATGDFSQIVGKGGSNYTLSEDANVTMISSGLVATNAGNALDLFFAIYAEDSAGANSHGLSGSGESLDVSVGTTAAFYDISTSFSLVADDYILAALGNGEDMTINNVNIRYDAGTGLRTYQESTSGAGGYATRKAEDPWTEVDSASSRLYSIYATYTASGGGATPTPVQDIIWFNED